MPREKTASVAEEVWEEVQESLNVRAPLVLRAGIGEAPCNHRVPEKLALGPNPKSRALREGLFLAQRAPFAFLFNFRGIAGCQLGARWLHGDSAEGFWWQSSWRARAPMCMGRSRRLAPLLRWYSACIVMAHAIYFRRVLFYRIMTSLAAPSCCQRELSNAS
jgi:hypothetical protein